MPIKEMHKSTKNPKTQNNLNFLSEFRVDFFELEPKTRLDSKLKKFEFQTHIFEFRT